MKKCVLTKEAVVAAVMLVAGMAGTDVERAGLADGLKREGVRRIKVGFRSSFRDVGKFIR